MRDLRREGILPSAAARSRHRTRITLTTLAAVALLSGALSTRAQGQIDPDDTGEGHKLGLAAEHNSGQTGTVTLLALERGRTSVVVRIASPPQWREIARLRRVRSCRSAGTGTGTPLSLVSSGLSRTTVALATPRLLSGNYIVEVFARPGLRVSCGELHGS